MQNKPTSRKNIGQLAIRRAYRTGALFFIIRAYEQRVIQRNHYHLFTPTKIKRASPQ